jgi:hypothetical protein
VLNTDFPGHALCVIGYDDNKYGGAFEVINSWGSRWGNDGFIWIRYNDFTQFTKYAFEVFSIDKDQNGMHQLSGKVKIRLNSGYNLPIEKVENGIFKTEKPLRTGTYFRLYLDSLNPSFVYVFGVDAANEYFKLFPFKEDISPALIYNTNDTAIPGENNYIEITGEPGEEKLYLLYSTEPINFENLIDNLVKYPGELSENLDVLLADKIMTPEEINWDESGIGFRTTSKKKTTLVVQINITHI